MDVLNALAMAADEHMVSLGDEAADPTQDETVKWLFIAATRMGQGMEFCEAMSRNRMGDDSYAGDIFEAFTNGTGWTI